MKLEEEIMKLEELHEEYLTKYNSHRPNDSSNVYHEWYNYCMLAFDKYLDSNDEDFLFFKSVREYNDGNGYSLHNNFNKIHSSYFVLIERLKNINKNNNYNIRCMSKNIFIVHGHDENIKEKVARCIYKLGYNPIILHEQADGGKTIIQKLEDNVNNLCYGIVIYSGCDEGRSKSGNSTEYRNRARQNVVFEHGYLNGVLGRNKVCCLYEEGVELPSDLLGVLYVKIDNEGKWAYDIVKNMKGTGLNVDANRLL